MCAKSGQDTCRFQKVMIKTSFPLVLLKENCTSLFSGLCVCMYVYVYVCICMYMQVYVCICM